MLLARLTQLARFTRRGCHKCPSLPVAVAVVRILIAGAVLAAVGVIGGATAFAVHPTHSSLAEMEWNQKTKRIEVSLRLDSFELERELSFLHGKTVNLETTPEITGLVRTYLAERISVSTPACPQCRIHWHGEELEFREFWVYFELELQPDADSQRRAPQSPLDSRKDESVSQTAAARKLQQQLRDPTQILPAVTESDDLTESPGTGGIAPSAAAGKPGEPGREATLPTELAGLTVRNTIMADPGSAQVNYVTFRCGQREISVHLTAEKSECDLDVEFRVPYAQPAGKVKP